MNAQSKLRERAIQVMDAIHILGTDKLTHLITTLKKISNSELVMPCLFAPNARKTRPRMSVKIAFKKFVQNVD